MQAVGAKSGAAQPPKGDGGERCAPRRSLRDLHAVAFQSDPVGRILQTGRPRPSLRLLGLGISGQGSSTVRLLIHVNGASVC